MSILGPNLAVCSSISELHTQTAARGDFPSPGDASQLNIPLLQHRGHMAGTSTQINPEHPRVAELWGSAQPMVPAGLCQPGKAATRARAGQDSQGRAGRAICSGREALELARAEPKARSAPWTPLTGAATHRIHPGGCWGTAGHGPGHGDRDCAC